MRFIVFSDNHRNRDYLKKMLADNPDTEIVISLGDSEMSEAELTGLGIFGVKGNYPFEPRFPLELNLEFGGFRFLFVHGHLFNVKNTLASLRERAHAQNIDVVFYGHTHVAKIKTDPDLIYVNPGALGTTRGSTPPSYAIIEANGNELDIKIIDVLKEKTILEATSKKNLRRER